MTCCCWGCRLHRHSHRCHNLLLLLAGRLLLHCLLGRLRCWLCWLLVCCRLRCLPPRHCCCCSYSHLHSRCLCFASQHSCLPTLLLLLLSWLLRWWLCLLLRCWLLAAIGSVRHLTWC